MLCQRDFYVLCNCQLTEQGAVLKQDADPAEYMPPCVFMGIGNVLPEHLDAAGSRPVEAQYGA